MKYNEIRNAFKEMRVQAIDVDIALSVDCALGHFTTNEEFNLLCNMVYHIWDTVDKGYTQLIADIVVDLYCDEDYGYRDEEKGRVLTKQQLEEDDYDTRNMIIEIFYDRYYD